jgi:hypothetical protein
MSITDIYMMIQVINSLNEEEKEELDSIKGNSSEIPEHMKSPVTLADKIPYTAQL